MATATTTFWDALENFLQHLGNESTRISAAIQTGSGVLQAFAPVVAAAYPGAAPAIAAAEQVAAGVAAVTSATGSALGTPAATPAAAS